MQPLFAGRAQAPTTWIVYQSPSGPTEAAGILEGSSGLGFWDLSFTSDALPFLDRVSQPKAGPRQPSMYYCEVGRVSCAGLQTYRDHLKRQKYRKKQVVQMTGTQPNRGPRGAQCLHWGLCAVSCARTAYMRVARHQKVSKLYTRLGKSIIPEPMPGSVTYT